MKKTIILFVIACVCIGQLQSIVPATNKIRLNDGWEFIRQDMANAWEVVRPAAYDSPQSVPLWTKVILPHCFNAEDAVDPDVNYYQGAGWYRIALDIDNPYPDGCVILEFEGAGQKADVYIYTTKVASHVGGYDGWTADITKAAAEFKKTDVCREQYKGKIPIIIRCDNIRNTEQIPSDMSDFNLYGGLYRYVNLVYVPKISFQHIRIDAVTDEKGKSGNLHITTSLYNPAKSSDTSTVTVKVKDPAGKEVYRNSISQSLDTKDVDMVSFNLKNPILWDVDNPQLYTCELTLDVNGYQTQAVEYFGFRHYEFKEKGPFFLNGKRLLLKGTHRHEDHAGIGSAMTEELMIKEMKLVKDMGVNFIRLGHYQQSDIILRLCDELGILVWEEIPWCRGGLGGEAYKEQARRMLTNLIEQHRNHPSVILWGLGNENDWAGDFETFDKEAIRLFMKELHELAHWLDNGRLTSIRRCDFCKDIVDVYSPSIWAGWYSRAFRNYREMSDAGIENTTRFFHAEWGGDSHAHRHAEGSFEKVSNAAKTGDWSESYIVRLFDWHLKEQEKMPQLSGSAFWTFKDFSTPLRPENPIPYVNQKGVVERDLTLKESYYVFQSYWTDKPMIHIYGHTWPIRWGEKDEKKELLVYSNCPEAELFVNGVSQGKKQRNSQDFPAAGLRWEVTLKEGTNTLRAVGFNKKQQITDEIRQEYQTKKWGKEAQITITQTPLNNDTILIQAELKDRNDIRCLDSRKFIEFDIAGNGKLIQNQGTSLGSRKVQAYNGVACIKVVKFGKCAISAKAGDSITDVFVTE
ncbi:Beta-galactosidase [termite gut metagenome]|uniref:Beta-galactosidase n=1 Tax=termite gut metagenome TaxID=433724 RepID=A0A5J4SXS1_9ZZZZ